MCVLRACVGSGRRPEGRSGLVRRNPSPQSNRQRLPVPTPLFAVVRPPTNLPPTHTHPPATPAFNHTRFHFAYPLSSHPSSIFEGESGCSPHSPSTYVAVRDMLVPALETGGPAIRTWRAVPTGEGDPANVTYLDLTSGAIVVGNPSHNWTTATTTFRYSVYGPNAVDRPQYVDALRSIKRQVDALVAGQATKDADGKANGYTCNKPVSQLTETARYLASALASATGDASVGMEGGLRPTETMSDSGCIVETAANYEGDVVGAGAPGSGTTFAKTPTADACCKLCKATDACSVFTWCPLTSGCVGVRGAVPYLGCALKIGWATESATSAPHASERGPPTPFTSGRISGALNGGGKQ